MAEAPGGHGPGRAGCPDPRGDLAASAGHALAAGTTGAHRRDPLRLAGDRGCGGGRGHRGQRSASTFDGHAGLHPGLRPRPSPSDSRRGPGSRVAPGMAAGTGDGDADARIRARRTERAAAVGRRGRAGGVRRLDMGGPWVVAARASGFGCHPRGPRLDCRGAPMELISKADKEKLESQLAEMIQFRPVIAQRIAEARAQGDLKENADYHAAREDQAMNEAKIREMEAKLARVQVAGEVDVPSDMVFLGATVRVKDVGNGREEIFRLVGQMTDAGGDDDVLEVTVTSPLGTALMRARVNETVRVELPRGERRYLIVAIM
ncbi:MAG: transcription elongation factor GreA [Planctomycetes bacterium]|nr:transcription elongation factor GreA [Planctomycetota bacterium]